jgi:hypothetical protein
MHCWMKLYIFIEPSCIFYTCLLIYLKLLLGAAETWPFLVSLLIKASSLEISASKRRNPKMIYAKTLRLIVQRAEDDKYSGQFSL